MIFQLKLIRGSARFQSLYFQPHEKRKKAAM